MNEVLETIARKHLDLQTLVPQHRDGLDFHEVAVWQVRKALEAAYLAGAASVEK